MKHLLFFLLITCLFCCTTLKAPKIQEPEDKCDPPPCSECDRQRLLPPGFQFAKYYQVNREKMEEGACWIPVLLSRDVNYAVRVKDDWCGKNKTLVTSLHDQYKKEIINNIQQGKWSLGWVFKCKQPGVYYIKFNFRGNLSDCGYAVLSYRR